jgi:hypothetical protein
MYKTFLNKMLPLGKKPEWEVRPWSYTSLVMVILPKMGRMGVNSDGTNKPKPIKTEKR